MYDIRTAILPFMFIFNHDLILHNISSWGLGFFILIMTCIANFAFASATQGWFVIKNRYYEIPLLFLVTLVMMRPGLLAGWLGVAHEQRYWMYFFGLAIFLVVYLLQRHRALGQD